MCDIFDVRNSPQIFFTKIYPLKVFGLMGQDLLYS